MAKIAVELERALQARKVTGEPGCATAHTLAQGDGWRVADVICTSGPDDRPFEERHAGVSIAVVAAGTFQYRAHATELLAPGSLLLGSPDRLYECAHHHAAGDRCVSFHYTPEFFESIVEADPHFRAQRLPPMRPSASLVARAIAGLSHDVAWEELAIEIAAKAMQLANGVDGDDFEPPPSAIARVTQAVRAMEESPLPLRELANGARLSPYHFLRTFTHVAGVTPHQFALRSRLRDAAVRLATDDARVIDVALDAGFGDVSNFNRTFRAEFGVSPRVYRRSRATTARSSSFAHAPRP